MYLYLVAYLWFQNRQIHSNINFYIRSYSHVCRYDLHESTRHPIAFELLIEWDINWYLQIYIIHTHIILYVCHIYSNICLLYECYIWSYSAKNTYKFEGLYLYIWPHKYRHICTCRIADETLFNWSKWSPNRCSGCNLVLYYDII